MKSIENECVDCDLPCLGDACKYTHVTHYYCDECQEEAELYYFEGEELCANCILDRLEKVEGSFY